MSALLILPPVLARTGHGIEAHRIAPKLWQGSVPPEGRCLCEMGIDMVVLCAKEHQPGASHFPRVEVLHVPFDDAELTNGEWMLARQASKEVAKRCLRGQRVLVTCMQGRNRSGLVVALALHRLTGWSGSDCIQHVRAFREAPGGPVLSNDSFVRALCRISATPGRPR